MALVVLDVPRLAPFAIASAEALSAALRWEQQLVQSALKHEVTPMLLFNVKGAAAAAADKVVAAVRQVPGTITDHRKPSWTQSDFFLTHDPPLPFFVKGAGPAARSARSDPQPQRWQPGRQRGRQHVPAGKGGHGWHDWIFCVCNVLQDNQAPPHKKGIRLF